MSLPAKRNRQAPALALDPHAMLERLWEEAGVTREERSELLRKAVDELTTDLTATKTIALTVYDEKGKRRTETETVPDNVARAKARDQVFNILGVDRAPQTQQVELKLEAPSWGKPAAPAASAEVLEATRTEDRAKASVVPGQEP